jgi:phenylacetate-CoA ligase
VEVVDEAAATLPAGREGRILLTNLHNYAMPFIRYENGDSGSLIAEACPCGRTLPLLSHVVGRRCDIVYTPSGRRIPGSNLGLNRLAVFPVMQFQLVQEELDRLVVRIVPRPGAGEASLHDMSRRIPPLYTEIVGNDVRIEVEFCGHIEPSAGGKHLFVISKVDPDSWLKRASS